MGQLGAKTLSDLPKPFEQRDYTPLTPKPEDFVLR
jgi:hypothetical protein